jgi:hypothetical protein
MNLSNHSDILNLIQSNHSNAFDMINKLTSLNEVKIPFGFLHALMSEHLLLEQQEL